MYGSIDHVFLTRFNCLMVCMVWFAVSHQCVISAVVGFLFDRYSTTVVSDTLPYYAHI